MDNWYDDGNEDGMVNTWAAIFRNNFLCFALIKMSPSHIHIRQNILATKQIAAKQNKWPNKQNRTNIRTIVYVHSLVSQPANEHKTNQLLARIHFVASGVPSKNCDDKSQRQ